MRQQDPEEVQGLYRAGVEAVAAIADSFSDSDWGQPACGEWDAEDTARHLLSVAGWYHSWLDRAIAGESTRPFPAEEIDAQTASALNDYGHLTGEEASSNFVVEAGEYLDRAEAEWDTPLGYPFGIVTVGLHCGVAAAEWHIHAWDLAQASGSAYEPAQARELFVAAGSCVAHRERPMRRAVMHGLIPLAARRSPWESLLKRAGRTPLG